MVPGSPSGQPSQGAEHQDVDELFAAHGNFVARSLWRMGAPHSEIEDLVQDVFLIAHSKGGFTRRGAKATTWLAAIAFRVWSSERRRFRRHWELPNDLALAQAADCGPSPADAAAAAQSIERIRRVLDEIDERSRATLILVDLEGAPCGEVAKVLGLPVGTVYSRLHSARRRFARAYEKLGSQRNPEEPHAS